MPSAERDYCFFTDQFLSTRDVHCDNYVTELFWGGLQYQLEHHLFPTMPRYNYPRLRPLIRKFAESLGLEYKICASTRLVG